MAHLTMTALLLIPLKELDLKQYILFQSRLRFMKVLSKTCKSDLIVID